MLVPSNKIQKNKYTLGGELVEKKTNNPYKGYYCIVGTSYYTGKSYTSSSIELIKFTQTNQLLNNSRTAAYSVVSGITSDSLKTPVITSKLNSDFDNVRYFCRQVNIQPINIKEVNKETYNKVKINALFQTTFIGPGKTIEQANQELPGLKLFLEG